MLYSSWINTPLGSMLAISNEELLFLIEFKNRRGLEKEIQRLRSKTGAVIVPGQTPPIKSIKKELGEYFKGKLRYFNTPVKLVGTPFQKLIWQELIKIPYGKTRSYQEMATTAGVAKAVRAMANANGANQLAVVIPCHRVINSDGNLGGYGGGLANKKWLLEHERKYTNS